MKTLGYYNGEIGEIEDMTVPMNDRANYFGDGVYDATVCVGYAINFLEEHVDRFYRSAAALGIVIPCAKNDLCALLRDLVRALSDERGLRVSLADERGELAALCRGTPQLRVGRHTDVLDACPKALAVPALLRAMNPQVIAVDEVAVAEDVAALELAAGAGVALLATVHAAGVEDLRKKPILAGMLDRGLFQKSVRIARLGEGRWYDVEDLP